jgi:ferredoxin
MIPQSEVWILLTQECLGRGECYQHSRRYYEVVDSVGSRLGSAIDDVIGSVAGNIQDAIQDFRDAIFDQFPTFRQHLTRTASLT